MSHHFAYSSLLALHQGGIFLGKHLVKEILVEVRHVPLLLVVEHLLHPAIMLLELVLHDAMEIGCQRTG